MAKRGRKKNAAPKDGEIVGMVSPKSSNLKVRKYDVKRSRQAKKALLAGGMSREAGMMIDGVNNTNTSYAPGFVLESYRNSYASGLGYKSGIYDIPTFINLMNSKNGGIIQWPSSLQERYSWFRWYARSEPLVSRALDLLATLPMSKLSFHIPKHVPEAMREEVKEFFEDQARTLNLFKVGEDMFYERNMIGNVYVWCEWDAEQNKWTRIQMLPPEEVFPFEIPFSDMKRIEYRPRRLVSMLLGNTGSGVNNEIDQFIVDNVPEEIVESIQTDGCILLESDPMKGSFCEHISRRKSPYQDLSASLLDRVLVPLQLKDFYKFTQLSLASRNMTPKYLVVAPNCTPTELDDLRTQWDLSYLDPDYAMVANFEVRVDVIGSKDRLLELASEYERLDNEIFAAMGVTRELLTGEGSYSGSKITVEILHTMFLHERETLVNFIEQKLFMPICEKRKWYTEKKGIKKYWYPKVGFNRLTIRDNAEVFDSLFQLYQKGSLPVEIIYELFNLDATEIDDKLYADLFTVRDATFNELIRGVLSDAGRGLVESSDIMEKISEYLKLKYQKVQEGGEGMPMPQQGGQAPDLASMLAPALEQASEPPAEPSTEPAAEPEGQAPATEETQAEPVQTSFDNGDIEEKAREVVEELPSNATPEEIMEKIVKKEKSWNSLSESEKAMLSDTIIKSLPEGASDEDIIKAIVLKTGGLLT